MTYVLPFTHLCLVNRPHAVHKHSRSEKSGELLGYMPTKALTLCARSTSSRRYHVVRLTFWQLRYQPSFDTSSFTLTNYFSRCQFVCDRNIDSATYFLLKLDVTWDSATWCNITHSLQPISITLAQWKVGNTHILDRILESANTGELS